MSTPSASGLDRQASVEACAYSRHAMFIWPRLDRQALARRGCDSRRIAQYVAHRTSLSVEQIIGILERSVRSESDPHWFG